MKRGAGSRRPGVRVYAPGCARKRYRDFLELVRMVDELETLGVSVQLDRLNPPGRLAQGDSENGV